MRLLLTLAAFVSVVLAIFVNSWWLYILAGISVLAAIGSWGAAWWKDSGKKKPRDSSSPTTRDELAALGIMEIREKSTSKKERKTSGKESTEEPARGRAELSDKDDHAQNNEREIDEQTPREESSAQPSSIKATSSPSMDQDDPATTVTSPPAANDRSTSSKQEKNDDGKRVRPSTRDHDEHTAHSGAAGGNSVDHPARQGDKAVDRELLGVLTPYLESLRAATDAQTAALIVQDEVAMTYRVQAISSDSSAVLPAGEQFETDAPLMTANLSRQPASIRLVGSDLDAANLGYYKQSNHRVEEIGMAPVSRPNHPSTFFLLLDTPHAFDWKRAQRLIARYADLLAVLLDTFDSDEEDETQQHSTSDALDRDSLPPRRQVIAEEMERARARDQELALAILYLNRAESIASKGEGAVAEAERALYNWLEQSAPKSRVEPFGELTYGVFFEGDVQQAETWAVDLQKKSEQAPSPLKGGVSIGMSMLRPRHQSPDALRGDATEALREAYTTGTCTILE